MNEESGEKILFETGLVSDPNVQSTIKNPFQINELRYSTHSKLIRTTAWFLRFIKNLKEKISKQVGVLTSKELRDAEILWIKTIQQSHFHAIKREKKNQMKLKLGLYVDPDGVLRCAGRLVNLSIHPKLLPKSSKFTNLCIVKCHRRMLHSG